MNCQDRSKELGEKVQHGFVAPEAPKSGGAESSIKCESRGPLTCERHAGLFKIGSMFYLVKSSLYINNRQPYGSLSNVLR